VQLGQAKNRIKLQKKGNLSKLSASQNVPLASVSLEFLAGTSWVATITLQLGLTLCSLAIG
jgi:hypothetical protein